MFLIVDEEGNNTINYNNLCRIFKHILKEDDGTITFFMVAELINGTEIILKKFNSEESLDDAIVSFHNAFLEFVKQEYVPKNMHNFYEDNYIFYAGDCKD